MGITTVYILGGGKITFYPSNSTSDSPFSEAACDYPHRGLRCRKTRVATPTAESSKKYRSQGRPLGYLTAWVLAHAEYARKDDHARYEPSLAEREHARHVLRDLRTLASDYLLSCERPARDDEPDEPLLCP